MSTLQNKTIKDLHHLKKSTFLWGRHANTYEVEAESLVKIAKWKIFGVKYLPLIMLFALLNTFGLNVDSLIGFALGAFMYLFVVSSFWLAKKLKTDANVIKIVAGLQMIFVSILIYYLMFKLDDAVGVETGVGLIVNYSFQSVLSIILFHVIYIDIKSGLSNYYYSKVSKIHYVSSNRKLNITRGYGVFGFILGLMMTASLVLGVPSYAKSLIFKIEYQKHIKKLAEKNRSSKG